jgi:hypothetical protein
MKMKLTVQNFVHPWLIDRDDKHSKTTLGKKARKVKAFDDVTDKNPITIN